MRKPIIAGNWKMYKTRDEVLQFVLPVANELPSKDLVDSVICAQFTSLRCLTKRQGENLRIGAQNMHYLDEGAYTGEVSAPMLKNINVSYVIIGHSERRAMFNETDESINKKLHKAFEYDITPILCVGRDLEGLKASDVETLVIAYEPIWAIGTGRTATAEVANETCGFVRSVVAKLYGEEVAQKVRIQYGGSVKTSNIDELMAMPEIDGALIGGASLKANDFITLVKAAVK